MSVSPDGRRPRIDGEHTRAQILTYLRAYHEAHQMAPTYAEIGAAVGVVRSNVSYHVRRLEHDGLVSIRPGTRGVTPTGGAS